MNIWKFHTLFQYNFCSVSTATFIMIQYTMILYYSHRNPVLSLNCCKRNQVNQSSYSSLIQVEVISVSNTSCNQLKMNSSCFTNAKNLLHSICVHKDTMLIVLNWMIPKYMRTYFIKQAMFNIGLQVREEVDFLLWYGIDLKWRTSLLINKLQVGYDSKLKHKWK